MNLLNILLLIKSRCRSGALWENLQNTVCRGGVKGRGFLMRHGKTLEERYFANATNIFTEREAAKILKKGCETGNSGCDKTFV